LTQKTKFADARQRIESKKQQERADGITDMRMKLLAKRRVSAAVNSTVPNPQPPSVQVSIIGPGQDYVAPLPGPSQGYQFTGTPSSQVQVQYPAGIVPSMLLAGSGQNRFVGPGQDQQVIVAGQSRVIARPDAATNVAVIGGSLKKTIVANPHLPRMSSSAPTPATTYSGDKLRITAHNEHALLAKPSTFTDQHRTSSARIPVIAGGNIRATYTVQTTNDSVQHSRPIETIVTCRP
jgi:hypothetical protein